MGQLAFSGWLAELEKLYAGCREDQVLRTKENKDCRDRIDGLGYTVITAGGCWLWNGRRQ